MRPHGPASPSLQLDDLESRPNLPKLAPAVFLALETSPGNFQAWLALPGKEDREFARACCAKAPAPMRPRAAQRASPAASISRTSTRPNFPRVTIHAAQPGRTTRPPSLSGLAWSHRRKNLRRCLRPLPARSPAATANGRATQCALDGAPLNSEETGPDISRADFVWCMTAITWGLAKEEIAETAYGRKAPRRRRNGKGYAELTVRNAAARRRTPQAAAPAPAKRIRTALTTLPHCWQCGLPDLRQ